jgi:hypothetical protein
VPRRRSGSWYLGAPPTDYPAGFRARVHCVFVVETSAGGLAIEDGGNTC